MTEGVRATDRESASLPGLVIDSSARDTTSKIWYALPSGFFDVPLAALDPAPGSEEEARLDQLMASFLDIVPIDVRTQYRASLGDVRHVVRYMEGEGVIGCSLGMHLADDGTSASSVVTVALRKIEWAPPKVTAFRAVGLREGTHNVGLLTLPGGNPASIADNVVSAFSAPGVPPSDLYLCSVYVPAASGEQLAVLTLSSAAVSLRPYYRQMMEGAAHTVSFVDPLPDIERAAQSDARKVRDEIAFEFG